MSKKLLATLALAGSLMFSANAMAAVRGTDAIEVAKEKLPPSIVVMGYDEDENTAIVNFRDPDNLLDYEVEVGMESGKVLKMDVEGSSIPGSTVVTKSIDEIAAIVLEEYPNAREMLVTLEQEGDRYFYEAEFVTDEYAAELTINPVTGAFSEREYVFF